MSDSEILKKARELVSKQADDEALWFVPADITEAYLQSSLRALHAAIEDTNTPESIWKRLGLEEPSTYMTARRLANQKEYPEFQRLYGFDGALSYMMRGIGKTTAMMCEALACMELGHRVVWAASRHIQCHHVDQLRAYARSLGIDPTLVEPYPNKGMSGNSAHVFTDLV